MNDFDDDEAGIHQLFASLREGWRVRVDLVARVRERLGIFEERYATPAADRWIGRSLVSFINAAGQLLGLSDADESSARTDAAPSSASDADSGANDPPAQG